MEPRKIRRVSPRARVDGDATTTDEDDVAVDDLPEISGLVPPEVVSRILSGERRMDETVRSFKAVKDDAAKAIGKSVQLSDELEQLKNETLENMQVAFDENAEILEAIEKDVTDLKHRLAEASQSNDLRAQLEDHDQSLSSLRDELSKHARKLEQDLEPLQGLRDEIGGKLREVESSAREQVSKARDSVSEIIEQRLSKAEKKSGEGLRGALDRIGEMEAGMRSHAKRAEDLEMQILELEEAQKKAGASQQLEEKVGALDARLTSMQTEIADDLEQVKGSLEKVDAALQAADGAAVRTREAMEKVQHLEEKLATVGVEVDAIVGRLQESAQQHKAASDRLNLTAKMVDEVENKIRRLVAPLDDALAELESFDHIATDGELDFELHHLLAVMITHHASDLHIKAGSPPIARLDGELIPIGEQALTEVDCKRLILGRLSQSQRRRLLERKELDFAYSIPKARFRINAFLTRGTVSAAIRMLRPEMPSLEELGLPKVLEKLASYNHGLILITGPAGAGKSTTLASMIEYINTTRKMHVITIEDPIEFVHTDKQSIITQREVGADTSSFEDAVKQALRQDPNVILIGEMRDPDTIMTAVQAAETGHLVLTTLHTPNTVQAIDRIMDVFSGQQQQQFRLLLANTLRGVISQRLLTRADDSGRVPAVEVLVITPTISSLILEGKTNEIYTYLQQGASEGMQTFTASLTKLYEAGLITKEEALFHSDQPTEFRLGVEGHTSGTTAYTEGDTLMNWL